MLKLKLLLFFLLSYWCLVTNAQDFLISEHNESESLKPCEEIIMPAYKSLNIHPVLIPMPGRRALYSANAGDTDAELCRIATISKHYPNLIRVEPAIIEFNIVALSIRPLAAIKTKADLSQYSLGSIRGMKAAEDYFQESSIQYVNNFSQVIKLLDDGLIDFAILTQQNIQRAQQKHYRKDFIIHLPPLFKHKLYHYIHQRHQKLITSLTAEIKRIKQIKNSESFKNKEK